jgi:hypothetical protein
MIRLGRRRLGSGIRWFVGRQRGGVSGRGSWVGRRSRSGSGIRRRKIAVAEQRCRIPVRQGGDRHAGRNLSRRQRHAEGHGGRRRLCAALERCRRRVPQVPALLQRARELVDARNERGSIRARGRARFHPRFQRRHEGRIGVDGASGPVSDALGPNGRHGGSERQGGK